MTEFQSVLARPTSSQADAQIKSAREVARLKQVGKEFEAVFLSEMLRHTGIGKVPEGFGGGAGEEAFSNFLTQEYAKKIANSGTFGLADRIFAERIAEAGS